MNKHLQKRKIALCVASLVTSVGMSLNATAQVLEEVVVTARQRTENLTDVPASITAFTETKIDRAGIERAEDFVALTPGVAFTNTVSTGDTSLSIRGLNGARDAETNFAFIIDGVLYTNPSAFNREFSDLKQIEVLKGPQGALYGRSASAGAVIVTTSKPTNETEGSVEASYSSNNTYVVKAGLGGALIEDELFGRVSFDYRDTDGDQRNVLTGEKSVNRFKNYSASGRLVWQPTDELTVDGKVRYAEVDAASITFNAGFHLPQLVDILGDDAFFRDLNDHEFVFSSNLRSRDDQETAEISLKVDYDFESGAHLTAWALYSDLEQSFAADGTSGAFGFYFDEPSCIASTAANTGAPTSAPTFIGTTPGTSLFPPYSPTTCDGIQFQSFNQKDASLEVRLASSADQRLRWNVGLYTLNIERRVAVAQVFDGGFGVLPSSFEDPNVDALVNDTFDTQVYSAFGALNYDVTPDVELSFALRYDIEKRKVSNNVLTPSQRTTTRIDYCSGLNGGAGCTLNGAPLVGTPLNPAFITDFATGVVVDSIADRSRDFSELQPKLSLTWDVSDDTTLFGSWGVGFKSGGFNNIGSNATIQNFLVTPGQAFGTELVAPTDTYEKETTSAFELGFKTTIADGRVKLNGAVFHTNVDDMQFFEFFVGPFGLLRVVENIDKATLKGFELGLSAQLTDGLTLNLGYSQIDGEIKENSIRPNTQGNDVPNAPEFTFTASLQYIQPVSATTDFVGHISYSRLGETSFHTVQDNVVPATLFGGLDSDLSRSRRDEYDTVNLRLGLEGEKWRVTAFASNLFDEEYLAEVITAPEFGGSFVHPAARRNYGLEVGYKF